MKTCFSLVLILSGNNKVSRPVGVTSAAKKDNRGQMPSFCDNPFPLAPVRCLDVVLPAIAFIFFASLIR